MGSLLNLNQLLLSGYKNIIVALNFYFIIQEMLFCFVKSESSFCKYCFKSTWPFSNHQHSSKTTFQIMNLNNQSTYKRLMNKVTCYSQIMTKLYLYKNITCITFYYDQIITTKVTQHTKHVKSFFKSRCIQPGCVIDNISLKNMLILKNMNKNNFQFLKNINSDMQCERN